MPTTPIPTEAGDADGAFDPSKPAQTRDGRVVDDLRECNGHLNGNVMISHIWEWKLNGEHWSGKSPDLDLVNVPPMRFTYRNHRGEVAERQVRPIAVCYGTTEWHPEPGWLLRAFDVDRGAEREFAMADMGVSPPASGEASQPVAWQYGPDNERWRFCEGTLTREWAEKVGFKTRPLYAAPHAPPFTTGHREGMLLAAKPSLEEVDAFIIEKYGPDFYNQDEAVQKRERVSVVRCLRAVAAIRAEAEANPAERSQTGEDDAAFIDLGAAIKAALVVLRAVAGDRRKYGAYSTQAQTAAWHLSTAARISTRPTPSAAGDVEARIAAASGSALSDVAAERRRQVEAEGWSFEHDDEHGKGELVRAAFCYALGTPTSQCGGETAPLRWPWHRDWWKPAGRRRNLVKAGALILAEIERLDRAEARSTQPAGVTAEARTS